MTSASKEHLNPERRSQPRVVLELALAFCDERAVEALQLTQARYRVPPGLGLVLGLVLVLGRASMGWSELSGCRLASSFRRSCSSWSAATASSISSFWMVSTSTAFSTGDIPGVRNVRRGHRGNGWMLLRM